MENTKLQAIFGDAEEELRHLPDGSVTLLIADPPFPSEHVSEAEREKYLAFTRGWLREAVRVLAPDGTLYVFMGMRLIAYVYEMMESEMGLFFNSWISWYYTQGVGKTKGFSPRHDDILMFTKSRDFVFNLDDVRVPQKVYRAVNNMRGANPGNVWEFSNVSRHSFPTQKPEALYERMILASSREGDLVVDPFLGSGTCLRVCQQTGRRAIGIDNDEACVLMAERRLEEEFTGFDSIDERMYRVPADMNDDALREAYIENHIAWFLKNHRDAIPKFLDNVYVTYRRREEVGVQLSLFD